MRRKASYLLDRVLGDVSHNGDLLSLAHAVRPGYRLLLYGRVPLRLDDVDSRSRRQSKAGFKSVSEDNYLLVLNAAYPTEPVSTDIIRTLT